MSASSLDNTDSSAIPDLNESDLAVIREQSETFLGQWNQLISRTNWEKGAIIAEWRKNLQDQMRPARDWSDESWSRLVGGVSPQHVGRLRRTTERFGSVWNSYAGLYWSHFYAALEWADAEMWLEGAVQNRWSVSQMRLQRWEVTGGAPSERPDLPANGIVSTEIAEENSSLVAEESPARDRGNFTTEPLDEGPDFGEAPGTTRIGASDDVIELADVPKLTTQALFERFNNLPEDVAEAVEAIKLCIIRHRAMGWSEISQSDMVDVLGALKMLAASQADAHGHE